mmetsp:Transcript_130210/g.225127  ORF Transcript_130210/g.225127 Transcript_130210/m.225127 type:complete len:90 (+) Transcript_130210:68-337(+)
MSVCSPALETSVLWALKGDPLMLSWAQLVDTKGPPGLLAVDWRPSDLLAQAGPRGALTWIALLLAEEDGWRRSWHAGYWQPDRLSTPMY